MSLIDVIDGGTMFKMKNLDLSRFGMSFLPPPGWPIAEMYMRSSHCLKSPRLSRSRLQKPENSMSWRTSSSVVWSPQALTSGIEMSSMKTVIFLLFGGPNERPRLSSSASTAFCAPKLVVANE